MLPESYFNRVRVTVVLGGYAFFLVVFMADFFAVFSPYHSTPINAILTPFPRYLGAHSPCPFRALEGYPRVGPLTYNRPYLLQRTS